MDNENWGAGLDPLKIAYWSRVGFGFLAALLCVVLRFGQVDNPFLTGISLALILYIVTYYVFKVLFGTKVKKKSKLVTMGIGAYFLTWILAWTLLNTLMHPAAVFTYSPGTPTAGNTIIFDATESYDLTSRIASYKWNFGDENETEWVETPIITHVYTAAEDYTVILTVKDSEGYTAEATKTVEVGG